MKENERNYHKVLFNFERNKRKEGKVEKGKQKTVKKKKRKENQCD